MVFQFNIPQSPPWSSDTHSVLPHLKKRRERRQKQWRLQKEKKDKREERERDKAMEVGERRERGEDKQDNEGWKKKRRQGNRRLEATIHILYNYN